MKSSINTSSQNTSSQNISPGNTFASYAVGYGRPPLHSRFREGRSGNPRGRPPKRADAPAPQAFRPAVANMRAALSPVLEAILRGRIERAVNGDIEAQRDVLEAVQHVFGAKTQSHKK